MGTGAVSHRATATSPDTALSPLGRRRRGGRGGGEAAESSKGEEGGGGDDLSLEIFFAF